MTPMEEFESLLKDVVNAKRMSASKVTGLTDLAMKNMKHDTQLVSILYRTHKSLPSPASKIWSLYVFDALSRAAKSHATKNNISGDISTQPGNAATFLLKVGGIVEGLFKDMITSDSSEAKEKAKKIYDIWVKGNTFPSIVLSQLAEVLKGTEVTASSTPQTSVVDVGTSHNQPSSATAVAPSQTPAVPALDPQTALLALLTQAAATTTTSTFQVAPNAATGTPQLDAAQLAVLQQLAHTAASVPSVPQSLPPADLVNVQNFPSSSGFNGSSQTPPEPRTVVKNEQRYGGYRSPEHEFRASSQFDDLRGRHRGGAFRGRGRGEGRGDKTGRNWDSRDYRYRDSDKDNWSQSSYRGRGRSRSKSPPRNGDNWGARYSPPRRSRELSSSRAQEVPLGSGAEPGKDEFGRDIRLKSPKSPPTKSPTPPPPRSFDPRNLPSNPHSTLEENLVTPITSNKMSSVASETPVTDSKSELGLEAFNPGTFDFTSPASWEALGKLWRVTHGAVPSQEHLMHFIMSYGLDKQMDTSSQSSTQDLSRSKPPLRGRGRWGHSRGRGGSTYGNGRMQNSQWDDSVAIVLGGDDGDSIMHSNSEPESFETAQPTSLNPGAGRMQKVGDKWVFVRGTTTNAS